MKSALRAALMGVATALLAYSPGVGFGLDLIVESRLQGKNTAQFSGVQGNWMKSQRKSSAPGLSQNTPSGAQRVILGRADEGEGNNERRLTTPPAVARFLPKLNSAQELYAYVTWPNGANVQPLTITVKHADGEEKIANAQRGYGAGARTNANRWIPLGKFKFAAGDAQYIELRVDPGFSPVYPQRQVEMYADAVRFTSQELSQDELAVTTADRPARRQANRDNAAAADQAGADADDGELRAATALGGGEPDDAEEVAVIPFDAPPLNGAPVLDDAGDGLPSFALPTTNGVHWHGNLDAARRVAQMSDLKLFLFFIGEDSPETVELDAVIKAPEPAKLISREYAAARLDFMQYKEVATQLGVTRPGWIVIYDAQGNALGSITSAGDADELAEQLRRF